MTIFTVLERSLLVIFGTPCSSGFSPITPVSVYLPPLHDLSVLKFWSSPGPTPSPCPSFFSSPPSPSPPSFLSSLSFLFSPQPTVLPSLLLPLSSLSPSFPPVPLSFPLYLYSFSLFNLFIISFFVLSRSYSLSHFSFLSPHILYPFSTLFLKTKNKIILEAHSVYVSPQFSHSLLPYIQLISRTYVICLASIGF